MKHFIIIVIIAFTALQMACKEGNKKKATNDANYAIIKLSEKIKAAPKDASLLFERGNAYLLAKKDSLAFEDYANAVEKDSNNIQYLLRAGDLGYKLEMFGPSLYFLSRASQLNPKDHESTLKVAHIYFLIKKYPQAFYAINNVLRADVYNYEAYFLKGLIYKDMKDTTNALSSFQTAAQINPDKQEAHMELALMSSGKDFEKSILYYKNAFATDSTNMEPLNGIGLLYMDKGDHATAKKYFINCIERNLNYDKAFYNIGCLLMDEDSIAKAQRQFDMAIKNNIKYMEAYVNRGLCKEQLQDKTGAIEDFKLALELDPNFQLAIDGLKRLGK
jgi:tetratricopeptide (TPR) repeat protein